MANRNVTILKAVVCVAWADGLLSGAERQALDGIIAAAPLTPEEAAELRAYAQLPRTLADLDVVALSDEEKRTVILHAVGLAFADSDYSLPERQVVLGLCERMGLPPAEAHALIASATARMSKRNR